MRFIEKPPKVLIIGMRKVPIIDATGINTINEVYKESKQKDTKLILSEVHSLQIMQELKKARLLFSIGKANVTDSFQGAIDRSKAILNDLKAAPPARLTRLSQMLEQDHQMRPDTGLFLSMNSNFMKMFTASRLLIVAAAAWILTGTLALASYHNDYIPAVQFAGIALLLDGLLLAAESYNCGAALKEKKWIVAEAAVDGVFSIPLLLDPVFTFFVFPFVVTPWIVTKGLVTMIAALSLKKNNRGWSGDLTGGFLLICCGLLIAHNPLDNSYGVNVLIGAIGWTIGLLYLYDAYRFRKINPDFHKGSLGTTTA